MQTAAPPVRIVTASPTWGDEFVAIARGLRECLGPLALRIDHIGSTSVPGLDAKDMIDVQVTVAALHFDILAPRFAEAGYQHRADIRLHDHRPQGVSGSDADWAKFLFTPLPGRRATNVHVRVAGKPNQRFALLFRDYLRTHPSMAAAYAELKRRLAALGIASLVYADVKDPACDLIMGAAEDWAAQTGWQPGPSDA